MTDFPSLVRALGDAGVEFIVVGGPAATAHGSARLTLDLGVVYRRTPENMARMVRSLQHHHPCAERRPACRFAGIPTRSATGLNFTLTTDLGPIDFLGEIVGGDFAALLLDSETFTLFGVECRCLSLERLIQIKRATGRVKDLEALAELEAIAEERRRLT